MTLRATLPWLIAALVTGAAACPDAAPTSDTAADVTSDVPSSPDVAADTLVVIDYTPPDYVPHADTRGDSVEVHAALSGAVRVIYDDRGIPHIYGDDLQDIAFVQGLVTARLRLFQMHTLRSAGSGRLGEFTGVGAVRGDILLRMHKLRSVAGAMATEVQSLDPELHAVLSAYAAGVNAHIEAVNAREVPIPLEVNLFDMQLEPWTVTDTMTIARLQTWDLGFGGYFDEDALLEQALALKATFDGTEREGIERDVLNFIPPRSVVTDEQAPESAASFDLAASLSSATYARLTPAIMERMRKGREWMQTLPHRKFRSHDFGSNNWVIGPEHSASGAAMVANDTHLALRNPSIFHHVHLSNLAAGGDVDMSGVNFAGAPGITLGTNGYGAWGATVFFSDVTDIYIETLNTAGDAVIFNGGEVAIDETVETFRFLKTGDVVCEDVLNGWVTQMSPSVVDNDDQTCTLSVTVQSVPHHGPFIPWSYDVDSNGDPIRMSWKWTGFEATRELLSIWKISRSKSVDDFKAALDDFGVGAQNWVWGDVDGNIAWYPSHDLPIRANVAAGDTTHPPFLPMPGDGSAEWTGMVPRADLPQVTNPAKGYIVTANSDPTGISLDNDPFNDGPYLGYVWNLGMRTGRIDDRIQAIIGAGGKLTAEDMKAIQADHRSNLAARIMPHVVSALPATGLAPELEAMRDALLEWDYDADSGVGAAAGSQEHKNAIATSIFNAFVMFLARDALFDEGIELGDHIRGRLLVRMLEAPETMVVYDPVDLDSPIWDDVETAEVETREDIIIGAFQKAHAWLSDPDKVGVGASGGFGSTDISTWLWGELHTLTMGHNVLPIYDMPKPEVWPNGYPRHGDLFSVDASHHGMVSESMTFSGGPSIRNVYEMTQTPTYYGVIPGGQSEDPSHPHYDSDVDRFWVNNLSPEVLRDAEAIWDAREQVVDFIPPSAVTP